jgi:hypothetical protein
MSIRDGFAELSGLWLIEPSSRFEENGHGKGSTTQQSRSKKAEEGKTKDRARSAKLGLAHA